jgi:glycosyltransferase involved in cell wall biosynthesis
MSSVAVVYLARIAHGVDAFAPFARSHKQFPAEYPHDLILAGKGMTKAGQRAATELAFAGIPHQLVPLPDDGYDIHAYLAMAEKLPHDYVLFCNTYTEFLTAGWLRKMMTAAEMEGVGLVGATASYESLLDSIRFITKAIWLTSVRTVGYDAGLASQFEHILQEHAPLWMSASSSSYRRLRRIVGDYRLRRPKITSSDLDAEFEKHWAAITAPDGPFGMFTDVSPFPNPHLRSNVLLIRRELLNSFRFNLEPTKSACNLFESGPLGLPKSIERLGLRQVLVGANGDVYDVEDWTKSKTFRLEDQSNLLAADNQTKNFAGFSAREKDLHQRMSWGDYYKPAPKGFLSLGHFFAKNQALLVTPPTKQRARLKTGAVSPKLISIVIPTHNRLALVKDAIETVRLQTGANWELVVFDNCSSEPVTAYVESLDDPRISCFRSDDFLPVTDSWNTAFAAAKGDYVMLIGDDDGLAPKFFERIGALIEQFDEPELIYSSIYQFFHPGVAPWEREGYVSDLRNGFFFEKRTEAFILSPDERSRAVRGSLGIRRNFTFNMQCFVFSRELIERVSVDGKFFLSPFPDYYTANAVFAMADKVVVEPVPLAIAGVSRASFGFTLFNNLETTGSAMLNTDLEKDAVFRKYRDKLLPGPEYLTKYILTMQYVVDRIGPLAPAAVDFERYRKMQILSFISPDSHGLSWARSGAGKELWRRLSITEKLWALKLSLLPKKSRKGIGHSSYEATVRDLDPTAFPPIQTRKNAGDYTGTVELFRALEDGSISVDMPASDRMKHKNPKSAKHGKKPSRHAHMRISSAPNAKPLRKNQR